MDQKDSVLTDDNKKDDLANNISTEVPTDNHNKDSDDKTNENNKNKKVKEKKTEMFIEKIKSLTKEEIEVEYVKLLQNYEKVKKILDSKQKETLEYFDKYKRTLADIENLRKRTIVDKQDSLKFANFNIINDLLVVLDDFQRAIDSAKSDSKIDLKHFVNGIAMIEKHFADLLFKKYGVIKYGKKDEEFDPKIHTAVIAEEGDFKNEIVLDVLRMGYILHDRVIRAAQVKVGKPK